MLNALIMAVVIGTAALMLMPRLANATLWRATITPLASIIGSGFLVIGPILHNGFGYLAPAAMMILCLIAYAFGGAIRYNIAAIDENAPRSRSERRLDALASWALAFAYVISVAYYLNLFGEFGLSLTELDDAYHARLLTTGVFLVILFVGWSYGFSALERMEQITVGIKLAIIAGLVFGLGWYFYGKVGDSAVTLVRPQMGGWSGLVLLFGLIVTVQGFETSRYLGETYDAPTRIQSMRLAQWLSAGIYLIYIGFLSFSFDRGGLHLDETEIIDMMAVVAPILSVLLVGAALSAQFSAAVADAGGSGGLVEELTGGRIKPRGAYALLVGAGLLLTWTSNVFDIISYASRAFAVYYALQCMIAALAARRCKAEMRCLGFLGLAVLGAAIAIFGVSVE